MMSLLPGVVLVRVSKDGSGFVADPIRRPGSPRVGRGNTLLEALGDFLIGYQTELGVVIEIAPTAQEAENERRAKR